MNRINIKLLTIFFIIITIISYNLLSSLPNKEINTEDQSINEVSELEGIDISPTPKRSMHNFVSSVIISSVIITLLAIYYQFFTLNSEIRNYILSALTLAGFKKTMMKFPSLIVSDEIQLKITGMKKIKIIITGPFYDNYQEFGLQKNINKKLSILSSRIISDIELLPLKLLLFKEYILENNK